MNDRAVSPLEPGALLGPCRIVAPLGIAFLDQDEKGSNGVFVQDFAPGRDTRATRRKHGGFDPEVDAETFGVSPDGARVAIAGREMVSSLVLLEGVAGLGPAK